MKIVSLIFLLALFPSSPASKKGVNFEHKQIMREISSLFKIEADEIALEQISEIVIELDQPEGRFYNILNGVVTLGHIYIGRVYTCPIGGCDNMKASTTGGSFEYFDYLVIFEPELAVSRVAVFNYQASHGQQICSKGWLRQFVGYSGTDTLKVGKDIDSISGATKSTTSITESVMIVQGILNRYNSNQ